MDFRITVMLELWFYDGEPVVRFFAQISSFMRKLLYIYIVVSIRALSSECEADEILFLSSFFCHSGSKSANVLAVLQSVAADALDLTGFYYSGKTYIHKRKPQVPTILASAPS